MGNHRQPGTCRIAVGLAVVLTLVSLIGLTSCDREPSSHAPAEPDNSGSELDGRLDDWGKSEPLWAEVGAVGRGTFQGIDLKQFHVRTDAKSLLIFIMCKPLVAEYYQEKKGTTGIGQIFLDTDNDPETGCRTRDVFGPYRADGFEFVADLSLAVGIKDGGDLGFVLVTLLGVNKDRSFSRAAPVLEAASFHDKTTIAEGEDGIEIAIPLKLLDVQQGQQVRIRVHEHANHSAKESFNEGEFVIK